jgi:hypothetical protein
MIKKMANMYYEKYRQAKEHLVGKEEKRDRSFAEQFFWVYVCFGIATVVIHLISFTAAVVFPAYHIEVMFGSFTIGVLLGLILVLTLIEVPKYTFFKVFFENYFKHGIKSFEMAFAGMFFVSVSIASSIFGVPLVVEKFAPSAELISIEAIEQKYTEQKQTEQISLGLLVDNATKEESEYWTKYKKRDEKEDRYRLSSDKNITETYSKLQNAVTDAKTALSSRLLELTALMESDIKEAKEENKARVYSHKSQTGLTSDIAFWIMLGLELIYVFGCCGRAYYKHREEHEQIEPNSTNIAVTDKQQVKHTKVTSRTKQSGQTVNKGVQVATAQIRTMQIQNQSEQKQTEPTVPTEPYHGLIFRPEGATVDHVYYENKHGDLTIYKQSDIARQLAKYEKKRAERGTEEKTPGEQKMLEVYKSMEIR